MKTKFILSIVLLTSVLTASASVVVSGIAPTVDDADIAQTLTQFSKSLATGGSLGQSITTGSDVAGYSLNAFTLFSTRELLGLVGVTFDVRISVLDTVATSGTAGYDSILATQTGFSYTGDLGNGDYLTFNLSPVTLSANTIYGIEVDVTSNGTGASFAGQVAARGSNSYALGNFYVPQATFSNSPLPNDVSLNSEDLTFWTNITVVPEPSAFALLAGCFGLTWVMLRRRG